MDETQTMIEDISDLIASDLAAFIGMNGMGGRRSCALGMREGLISISSPHYYNLKFV